MIFKAGILALIVAATGATDVDTVVNATKFDLAVSDGRVVGCTITATSGNPKVDRYICESARACGDRYASADRRDGCVADKRRQLADIITKNPKWLKF